MSLSTPEQQLLLEQLARCYGIEPSQLYCLTDNPEDGVYGFTRHVTAITGGPVPDVPQQQPSGAGDH